MSAAVSMAQTDGKFASQPLSMGLTGCANCLMLGQCGGSDLPLIYKIGCVNYAVTKGRVVYTDDMDPAFEGRFWDLWRDVNGLVDFSVGELLSVRTLGLPNYLPQLQHRYVKRARAFNFGFVALPMFEVIGRRRDGTYGPKFNCPASLRSAYGLQRKTRVVLVGVDHDQPIERFWQNHGIMDVCRRIADLEVEFVTVPNFSCFTDVPRFQIMRNHKRILLAAERLSTAGVRVVPHIHGNTDGDWEFWRKFLGDHREIGVINLEFQTGPRRKKIVGSETFRRLVELQQRAGRRLHPIIVGGARSYSQARLEFKSFTLIDSVPFVSAMKRRVILREERSGKLVWRHFPTPKGGVIHHLVEANIEYYPRMLELRYRSRIGRGSEQPALGLATSTPYFTAQP